MSKQFRYDLELDLKVPPGCYPIVKVEMSRKAGGKNSTKNSTMSIFGYLKDATFTDIEVKGPQQRLQLPFNRPKIYVQHPKRLKNISIEAVGWVEPDC